MKTITFFLVLAIITFLDGLTISILWGWFIVPIFFLPALSLFQAAGIGLLINFTTAQKPPRDKEFNFYGNIAEVLAYKIIAVVITLSIGWVLS